MFRSMDDVAAGRRGGSRLGQMTVLMRQAGLIAPGVYGPAQEEWAKFGMPGPAH